jgi:hypothetical protein
MTSSRSSHLFKHLFQANGVAKAPFQLGVTPTAGAASDFRPMPLGDIAGRESYV